MEKDFKGARVVTCGRSVKPPAVVKVKPGGTRTRVVALKMESGRWLCRTFNCQNQQDVVTYQQYEV